MEYLNLTRGVVPWEIAPDRNPSELGDLAHGKAAQKVRGGEEGGTPFCSSVWGQSSCWNLTQVRSSSSSQGRVPAPLGLNASQSPPTQTSWSLDIRCSLVSGWVWLSAVYTKAPDDEFGQQHRVQECTGC
jgi:hypothetical protein